MSRGKKRRQIEKERAEKFLAFLDGKIDARGIDRDDLECATLIQVHEASARRNEEACAEMAGAEEECAEMKRAVDAIFDEKRKRPSWAEISWDEIDTDELLSDLPTNEEVAQYHQFSPQFEARMEYLFAEARRREEAMLAAKATKEDAAASAEEAFTRVAVPETNIVELAVVREEKSAGGTIGGEPAEVSAKKPARRRMARWMRNAAVAAACMLVVLGVSVAQGIEAGAVFGIRMEVFREVCEEFVKVTWGSNQKEPGKVVVLEPEEMLEGYVEVERVVSDSRYKIVYKNSNSDEIRIVGENLLTAMVKLVEEGELENERRNISGQECFLRKSTTGTYTLEWENYSCLYNIAAKSEEIVLKIAKQMIKPNE